MADDTPTLCRLTDDLREAELLLLDRCCAARDAIELLIWHWAPDATGPAPRQAIAEVIVDLAAAVALDAKRADLLAEPMQW